MSRIVIISTHGRLPLSAPYCGNTIAGTLSTLVTMTTWASSPSVPEPASVLSPWVQLRLPYGEASVRDAS